MERRKGGKGHAGDRTVVTLSAAAAAKATTNSTQLEDRTSFCVLGTSNITARVSLTTAALSSDRNRSTKASTSN